MDPIASEKSLSGPACSTESTSYVRYLGWDCANKSLAHALVTINESALVQCDAIPIPTEGTGDPNNHEWLISILTKMLILKTAVHVESLAVKDLLPGAHVADVSEIERLSLLATYLTSVVTEFDIDSRVKVIIEHQPANMNLNNDKSAAISNGIAMFFILRGNQVSFISPRAKNAMVIGGYELRKDATMTSAQKYRARKAHTVSMMHHLSYQYHFRERVLALPRDCLDDAADALIQIFAHRKKAFVAQPKKTPITHPKKTPITHPKKQRQKK